MHEELIFFLEKAIENHAMNFLCSTNFFTPFELVAILKRLGHIKRDVQNNKKLLRKNDGSEVTPAWVNKTLEDQVKFRRLTEANKVLVDNEYFEPHFYGEKVAYDDSLISLNSAETEYNKVCCFL